MNLVIDEVRGWVSAESSAAPHLERTYDWTLELQPDASEALRLAALSHDMERAYREGSPRQEAMERGWGDPLYTIAHCERSARIVGDFLREHGASEPLVRQVVRLILAHETGGWEEADVLQAADSLSFFDTNVPLLATWVLRGGLSPEVARGRLTYAVDRLRHERGRALAAQMLPDAMSRLDEELRKAGD